MAATVTKPRLGEPVERYVSPLKSWEVRQERAKLAWELLDLMRRDLRPGVTVQVHEALGAALEAVERLQGAIAAEE